MKPSKEAKREVHSESLMHWTPEQDAILRRHYPTAPLDEIAGFLEGKKSINAIQKRAIRLHITRYRKSKNTPQKKEPTSTVSAADYPESKQYGYVKQGERLVIPVDRWPICNGTAGGTYTGAELNYSRSRA